MTPGASQQSPRFPLKGSFKGCIDINTIIDSNNLAASINWGSFQKEVSGAFKGLIYTYIYICISRAGLELIHCQTYMVASINWGPFKKGV